MISVTELGYYFLPQLLLRTPHYSFAGYDLSRAAEVLHQQDFRNAILLASPEFYRALEKKDFEFGKLLPKEIATLYKYYNRICFRPTPFGSFASFTLLNWGNGEAIRIGGNKQGNIHLLPDQELLYLVKDEIIPDLAERQLILNPCLYKVGNLYRYTRSLADTKGKLEFNLEALDAVKFHRELIALFKGKPLAKQQVLEWIKVRGACSPAEANEYLNFLTDHQVLLKESSGKIIYAGEPYDQSVPMPGWHKFWNTNRNIPLDKPFSLAQVFTGLDKSLSNHLRMEKKDRFYAALEKPHLQGGPGIQEQQELSAAVAVLQRLVIHTPADDLTTFIQNFQSRFDREKVPLLLALDPDTGIAYGRLEASADQPKPLENIMFPDRANGREQTGWTSVHRLLFRLWTGDTLRDPWAPLNLNASHLHELDRPATHKAALPQTLAVMYRKTSEYLLMESAGGATATAMIGRFSVFSEAVQSFCKHLTDIETDSNPGVVFADIGQLSDHHIDNVNRRRQIYPYEIPVNVFSDLPPEAQITPGDLLISVRKGEILLESKKLSKRVIPRLATAYNYRHNSLPVFRFLCDLQFQGLQANLKLDLEKLFPGLKFYPRVSFGKTILSPAKWIFDGHVLQDLLNDVAGNGLENLEKFRSVHHLPRHVALGFSDKQLIFDLASPGEGIFFLQCIKGAKTVTLREYLMSGRNVLSGNKPHAGQMIAFLAHNREIYPAYQKAQNAMVQPKDRSFLMGSDWLYLKLYCTPRVADELLATIILPFTRRWRNIIRKWFFIRYDENGPHLRLRIQTNPENLGKLMVAFRRKLTAAGYERLIKSYQGDTYRRELERYGSPMIAQIETIFCAGSELVARAIKERDGGDGDLDELELAIISADQMLRCFLPDPSNRLDFLNRVTDLFHREFVADRAFMIDLDTKFRELKAFFSKLPSSRFYSPALKNLTDSIVKIVQDSMSDPADRRNVLLGDLIHMQMNRTFSTKQREQEFLVYYLLKKQTQSLIARNK